MSVAANPSIATGGLIFAYDTNNIMSYDGPPINNVANGISVIGTGTGTGYSSTASTPTEFIPSLGSSRVFTNTIQNNYTSFTPNSGDCCPSLQGWGQIAVSPSTLYTYGIVFRCDSGYTNSNYMYRYEYTSNGGSYVGEGGVYSDARRISLGDGWFYAWGTFTTAATTNWLGHCGTFYYRYSPNPDNLSIARVMIAAGDYSGLHPVYWPSTNTSRPNTQVLLDISGSNRIITANSLTYASDGTISFNGTTNNLTIPTISLGNGNLPWTVSAWVRTTTNASALGHGSVMSNQSGGPVYSMMGVNSGKIVYWTYQNSAWAQKLGVGPNVNDNVWHMLTWVNNSNNTMAMYVDGVLDSNVADSTSGNNNPIDMIGSSWSAKFAGSIGSIQVYNVALTAAQVAQNFAAYRTRYSV
jgi:hypothetical protein